MEDHSQHLATLSAETLAYSVLFGVLFDNVRKLSPDGQALTDKILKEAIGLCELTAQASGPGPQATRSVAAADIIEQIRIIADPRPKEPKHGV